MGQKNQGGGDREAAKEYNESGTEFVEGGGVEKHQDEHQNLTAEQQKELDEAKEAALDKVKD